MGSGRVQILTDLSEHEAVIGRARRAVDTSPWPELSALFDTVVAVGIPSVVVDLGELDLLTPECLALVADAAERLATRTGRWWSARHRPGPDASSISAG